MSDIMKLGGQMLGEGAHSHWAPSALGLARLLLWPGGQLQDACPLPNLAIALNTM